MVLIEYSQWFEENSAFFGLNHLIQILVEIILNFIWVVYFQNILNDLENISLISF